MSKFQVFSRDEDDHIQHETTRTDKSAAYADKGLIQDILYRHAWVVEVETP
jgi:hypothetical protein